MRLKVKLIRNVIQKEKSIERKGVMDWRKWNENNEKWNEIKMN